MTLLNQSLGETYEATRAVQREGDKKLGAVLKQTPHLKLRESARQLSVMIDLLNRIGGRAIYLNALYAIISGTLDTNE